MLHAASFLLVFASGASTLLLGAQHCMNLSGRSVSRALRFPRAVGLLPVVQGDICSSNFQVDSGFVFSGSVWNVGLPFAVTNDTSCCAACDALPECVGFELQYFTSTCQLKQIFGPLSGLGRSISSLNLLGLRSGEVIMSGLI